MRLVLVAGGGAHQRRVVRARLGLDKEGGSSGRLRRPGQSIRKTGEKDAVDESSLCLC